MSGPYVRFIEAPEFVMHYPTCSACQVDLDHDGDGWTCPKCLTAWDGTASDGDKGSLYGDWSGEDVTDVPVVSHDAAPRIPHLEHPYEAWLTASGLDMQRCLKCFQPKAMHTNGGAA